MNTFTKEEADKIIKALSKFDEKLNYNFMK